MTVKELIAKLSKYDPELPVRFLFEHDWQGEFAVDLNEVKPYYDPDDSILSDCVILTQYHSWRHKAGNS